MITKLEADFFLSFQFLEKDMHIEKSINFINSLNLHSEISDERYYLDKIKEITSWTLFSIIKDKKINEIWILLSWGVDSFLLLHFLRARFPKLKIYSFTMFYREPSEKERLDLSMLSQKYKTIHKNIYKNIYFKDIIYSLTQIYKDLKEPIWDIGLIENYMFLKEVKTILPWKYIISWDWIDVLFAWMSMYRMSYLENKYLSGFEMHDKYFSDKYEKQYLLKNVKSFNKDFFYKYWEFFWFENDKNIEVFYKYKNKINKWNTILKKQIYFTYVFLVENRKSFIYESWELNNFTILTPFIEKDFVRKIFELDIPDRYLLSWYSTKLIIRNLATIIKEKEKIKFDFINNNKIDFHNEFNKSLKYIFAIWKYLFKQGFINKDFLLQIPNLVRNSMWYENKIRIYLLINLYFLIKSEI